MDPMSLCGPDAATLALNILDPSGSEKGIYTRSKSSRRSRPRHTTEAGSHQIRGNSIILGGFKKQDKFTILRTSDTTKRLFTPTRTSFTKHDLENDPHQNQRYLTSPHGNHTPGLPIPKQRRLHCVYDPTHIASGRILQWPPSR